MSDFRFLIPTTEIGMSQKLDQFKTGFAAHFAELGYDAADVSQIAETTDDFADALSAAALAKSMATIAVLEKENAKQAALETARTWVQRVKTNPAATPEMFAAMGITPASAPGGPVAVPLNLSADPSAAGTCKLKWSGNGNSKSTIYVIESNTNDQGWVWLGNSTKKSFVDRGAVPGVPKLYRVRAQRGDRVSPPSSGAAIYSGGGENVRAA